MDEIQIDLRVDGSFCEPYEMGFLYRKDRSSDHRFVLVLNGKNIANTLGAALGDECPKGAEVQEHLWSLSVLFGALGQSRGAVKYIANWIDRVSVAAGSVRIEGFCSEFGRAQQDADGNQTDAFMPDAD
ncbi:MAG: hypothetical protein AAFX94_11930 [Myxococcota bacterium]